MINNFRVRFLGRRPIVTCLSLPIIGLSIICLVAFSAVQRWIDAEAPDEVSLTAINAPVLGRGATWTIE